MKKLLSLVLVLSLALGLSAVCAGQEADTSILVKRVDDLPADFLLGADVSSLLALEESGVTYYDFDGNRQDMLKVLADAGVNCVRVRVWNDPFDAAGNGYGGGNCTLDTAIAIGRRAAEYGMGLLVDFHYSDFWADPSKQQAPKAWKSMSLEERQQAI